jgi:hypothetical protein
MTLNPVNNNAWDNNGTWGNQNQNQNVNTNNTGGNNNWGNNNQRQNAGWNDAGWKTNDTWNPKTNWDNNWDPKANNKSDAGNNKPIKKKPEAEGY